MPLSNPNHHLWRNGRLWWVAFTVVYDGWRQERVRRSLGTDDIEAARQRRDALLLEYAAAPNAEVVAFRLRSAHVTPPFQLERETYGLEGSTLGLASDGGHV
ncbi:MAG TPA: hypothetical protein VK886_00435 [Vicinamibacterales bacterium]|nr:hypothetical protein [Vicinamibacterales bacterium]